MHRPTQYYSSLVDVNIRFRPDPFELAALLCSQLLSFGISESTSTPRWSGVPMWLQLCTHALQYCGRLAAFDILCHVQPCWHCFVHLLSASWTTVVLCWLVGAPGVQLNRLQSVLNAAARLVFPARKYEHTSPLLRELHWLKVPQRIQFRLCVLSSRISTELPCWDHPPSFQLCNASPPIWWHAYTTGPVDTGPVV